MNAEKDINVVICERIADLLQNSAVRPSNCQVEVDFAPDLTVPETAHGRLVVCPSTEVIDDITRDGTAVRDVVIEIGYFKQVSKKQIPSLLKDTQKIMRFLDFTKDLNIPSVSAYGAERVLLYDPIEINQSGVFRSVISLKLKVKEC